MLSPINTIIEEEFEQCLLKFCSYVSILNNKKMNSIAVFTLIIKNDNIREIFKKLTQIETDYDVIRLFLKFNPKLCKSKVTRELLIEFSEQQPKANL